MLHNVNRKAVLKIEETKLGCKIDHVFPSFNKGGGVLAERFLPHSVSMELEKEAYHTPGKIGEEVVDSGGARRPYPPPQLCKK